MTEPDLPFPPSELRERVFAAGEDPASTERYEHAGAQIATVVESALPPDWTWSGARVLDFACGAGRVARHLAARHPDTEIFGCDVHTPSIEWLQSHPMIGVTAVSCAPDPPLSFPDDQFDLVYGISAFTHIAWNWSAWIAEMHRILRPGGLLVVTLLGTSGRATFLGRDYLDDEFGLLVVANWNPAVNGGPIAILSDWWRDAHWGRAFEPLSYSNDCFVVGSVEGGSDHYQSVWLGRARPGGYDPAELEALEPDPREAVGLAEANRILVRELELLTTHGAEALREMTTVRPVSAESDAPPEPRRAVRLGRALSRRDRRS